MFNLLIDLIQKYIELLNLFNMTCFKCLCCFLSKKKSNQITEEHNPKKLKSDEESSLFPYALVNYFTLPSLFSNSNEIILHEKEDVDKCVSLFSIYSPEIYNDANVSLVERITTNVSISNGETYYVTTFVPNCPSYVPFSLTDSYNRTLHYELKTSFDDEMDLTSVSIRTKNDNTLQGMKEYLKLEQN